MDSCISLKHVNHFFGKKQILSDICLEVPYGCIYGLLGPSGGGKTTMVKIMAGILAPTTGEAFLMSKKMPERRIMGQIGYMTQGDALYPALSSEENLRFFGALYGMGRRELDKRIPEVMDLVDLAGDREKQVKNFSGGMKRRLSLAAALLHRPGVLILDEPTVGIDPLLKKTIWEQLRRISAGGTTIVITTHVMDETQNCHRLAMLREGTIISDGTPEDLVRRSGTASVEEAFLYYEREGERL
ncbi:ABC transporter ATP-binding protein [Bacilliculturomica massiliensis]|uniref:ABC transporter ATP-binding protein n=1 Tax=Bacilliculturomica massiliensis TaxID=1917867 RepID=UPI0010301638|nr:ABC transporter ATP-binding protein [Bacilliculturomica massiliensis]